MPRLLLMIFVKFPEPGKVKTRLAKALGNEGAAEVYRQLVARVAKQVVAPSGAGDGWSIWIVFDPEEREADVRQWLDADFGSSVSAYLPQNPGDLGDRLRGAFAAGFAAGFEKVAAIGTDCVDLGVAGIGECWRRLDEIDVVFGPADDGGYYLIGLKAMRGELFDQIPWSSEQTLEVSKRVAVGAGLMVGELETLTDIDEVEHWEALRNSERWRTGAVRS